MNLQAMLGRLSPEARKTLVAQLRKQEVTPAAERGPTKNREVDVPTDAQKIMHYTIGDSNIMAKKELAVTTNPSEPAAEKQKEKPGKPTRFIIAMVPVKKKPPESPAK